MKYHWISVDIEANGPIPGKFSMIEIGAVYVDPILDKTFSVKLKPLNDNFEPEALKAIGIRHVETYGEEYLEPHIAMEKFNSWLQDFRESPEDRLMFLADTAGFDWMFVCWYFHTMTGSCPFGYSSTSLSSLYKGYIKNFRKNFKHLRKTKHTHKAVDDAMGNAEAFLEIKKNFIG